MPSEVVRTSAAAGVDVALGGTNEPVIAINPLDIQNVSMSSLFQSRVSIDGGVNWTAAASNVVPAGYGRDGDPSMAFGHSGRLFYSYQGFHNTSGGADEFISELNPVTGVRIAGPFKVSSSGPFGAYNDKDWIAVDRSPESQFQGRIYMVWSEFPTAEPVRVRTSFSIDDGATWSLPETLSISAEGFPWPAHIAVAPNGDVYISYHAQPGFFCNPDGVSGRVYIVRSTDGGVSYPQKTEAFGPGEADTTYNVQDCLDGTIAGTQFWMQGSGQAWVLPDPHIRGQIYVVANDDPDNDHDFGDPANVYLTRSSDFGLTWSAPVRVDDGPGNTLQVFPAGAIDDVTGCIVALWYDNRNLAVNGNGRYLLDVHYAISTDRGLTFSPSVQLNDVAFDPDRGAPTRFSGPPPTKRIGEYIGVVMHGGDLHAVWCGNTAFGQQTITDSQVAVCGPAGPPAPDPDPSGISNNRYLSFAPPVFSTAGGAMTALRVTIGKITEDAQSDLSGANGAVRYVGPPSDCPDIVAPDTFKCATLSCTPHYTDWSAVGLLHVSGAEVAPGSRYAVRALDGTCAGQEDTCGAVSVPLAIETAKWGDIVVPFGGGSQPNFEDISVIVDAFRSQPNAPGTPRTDLVGAGNPGEPNIPNQQVDFGDISAGVDAFRGFVYPFTVPACP